MLTTGQGTHYCKHCGFDMKAKEERMCSACDGDFCEPKKRDALVDLRKDHPRVIAARKAWIKSGCRHRPECLKFEAHMKRLAKGSIR